MKLKLHPYKDKDLFQLMTPVRQLLWFSFSLSFHICTLHIWGDSFTFNLNYILQEAVWVNVGVWGRRVNFAVG